MTIGKKLYAGVGLTSASSAAIYRESLHWLEAKLDRARTTTRLSTALPLSKPCAIKSW